MSRVWGLTGMTGAGKSTAAAYFARQGAAVVDADRIAHEALHFPAVKSALVEAFGAQILTPEGEIDRRALAERAFINGAALARLNAITHPAILRECARQIDAAKMAGIPLVLLDAPLLYQSGAERLCDGVLFLTAAPETQRARIIARDGLDEAAAQRRLDAQAQMAEFAARADLVIDNDSTLGAFEEKLEKAYACMVGADERPPNCIQ